MSDDFIFVDDDPLEPPDGETVRRLARDCHRSMVLRRHRDFWPSDGPRLLAELGARGFDVDREWLEAWVATADGFIDDQPAGPSASRRGMMLEHVEDQMPAGFVVWLPGTVPPQ